MNITGILGDRSSDGTPGPPGETRWWMLWYHSVYDFLWKILIWLRIYK